MSQHWLYYQCALEDLEFLWVICLLKIRSLKIQTTNVLNFSSSHFKNVFSTDI